MLLKNKTILITGSSRGIGAATARLAKEYGAEVVLHGKTESEYLKQLALELDASYLFCDVANETEVKIAVDKLDNIDILVNSAGINLSKPFLEQTTESWRKTFDVNVLGTVNFSKAVILKMGEKGKIINISSVKGFSSTAGSPAYAASKAAIINLTSSMAKEFAPRILVNAVAPGFTNTEMTENTMSDRIKKQISEIILKRLANPKEIAEVILFLASDKSSYITGQTIFVDGGYTLKM
jgi:3-oxoacyl-[acyl-carrier protein] reductase